MCESDERSHRESRGLLSPLLTRWRIGVVRRRIQPGERVLDIGCGLGDLARAVPRTCSYVGVDRFAPETDSPGPDVQFITCDLHTLDAHRRLAEAGPFDAIVLAAVIEHLHRPSDLLARLSELLSDRGRFILTTPTPAIESIHRLGGRLGIFSSDSLTEEHADLLDERRLRELCADAGLEVAEHRHFQFGLNQVCVARPRRTADAEESRDGRR
jgi:2-polyprenyl-3-methyl-5-hydroxy-6-metoxy-1,4-benzoquinol methylase